MAACVSRLAPTVLFTAQVNELNMSECKEGGGYKGGEISHEAVGPGEGFVG